MSENELFYTFTSCAYSERENTLSTSTLCNQDAVTFHNLSWSRCINQITLTKAYRVDVKLQGTNTSVLFGAVLVNFVVL